MTESLTGPDERHDAQALMGGFGPRAAAYAASSVHASDSSLDKMRELASSSGPEGCEWTVDVGTGAGFTAFAMAGFSRRVVASDPARSMAKEARRLGVERGLANLSVCQNSAEALPYAGGSVHLVTCRVAAHHFTDFGGALDEMRRVMKHGAALIMADTAAPEDDAAADWMNNIDLRRDYSHVMNRKVSEIEGMLTARGLEVMERAHLPIELRFGPWVARTNTPDAEAQSLRCEFLNAPKEIAKAFQIRSVEGEVRFSWPCFVFRAVKK